MGLRLARPAGLEFWPELGKTKISKILNIAKYTRINGKAQLVSLSVALLAELVSTSLVGFV